jgi:hypothetical protein
MTSILRKITRADVVREPFPHVVIDGALEDELYARLVASFPPAEAIVHGLPIENNAPYRMPAARLLEDVRVDACWKEFVRYHTSAAFFAEAVALFPELERFRGARTSVRNGEPCAEVALDCQPCWGAPVKRPSSSDTCHVDRPITLFGGLLYCRLPGDDAEGGDLELYRFRGDERLYDATRHVDPSLVEPFLRIPYAANRLVFFLQSAQSLHGVTVRGVTRWPRLHVNFLAQLQTNFFELAGVDDVAMTRPASPPVLASAEMLRVPTHPGPSLDARDDELVVSRIHGDIRNPTGTNHPPVIPSVERGTWVGGDTQDELHRESAGASE